jgi:pimeloyl-CoA dehydrogenase small subunit
MDFELSEEQLLLRQSVTRVLADHYGFEKRTAFMREPEGWSRDNWRRYAELGLLGLAFAEEEGGSSGGPVETMIVMDAFGRALVVEPYFATVVLGGNLLRHGGQSAFLPKIAAGEVLVGFAHAEPQARYDLADVATTARKDGSGYIIDGTKTLVLHGDSADQFVVSARLSGGRRDQSGLALFLVDGKTEGVSRRGYPTIDGQRAAEVTFANVRVGADAAIGEPGDTFPLIARVTDTAIAALAAEAVGCMAAMQELTVEYLKTRKQFGIPIGGFQVLQHKAADMLIALEQARSMAMLAAMMVDEPDAAERRKTMAAVKVQIGRSGRLIGKEAIQLHGGIGMTDEYKIGHYFKRVTVIDTLFGDADHHLAILAGSDGLVAAT